MPEPRLLERHGLAPEGLAKQACYVDDFAAEGDIQRLAAVALGAAVPATTVLAVPSVDPDPRVRLKLDALAHAGPADGGVRGG